MTIAIILSTHGSLSKELLITAEMIAGKQQNIAGIDLLPSDNTDTLVKKYNMQLSNLNLDLGLLFLVDIWGGTPFNAAQRIITHQKNSDIIVGINIPMLIEIFIERNHILSIEKLVQVTLKSGSKSIRSVKYSLTTEHTTTINKETNILPPTPTPPTSTTISIDTSTTDNNDYLHTTHHNQIKNNYMTICVARIDDRLIHGQVVTRWAKEYKINRIIVINDNIAQDVIRKNLLTQVTPPGITAHVIDIQKAIRVYKNPKYSKDRVIMLFTNPADVLRIIEGGVLIKSINIGGMAFHKGKTQINNAISVDSTDIEAFKKLDKLGIELEIRKVPSDSSLKIMQLIKNIN